MSSPIRLLARQASLTPAEFTMLAEDQMRSLLGGFPGVQLDELRSLPCLWSGAGSTRKREPFRDSPIVDAPHELSSTVRGSFFAQPDDQVTYHGEPAHPDHPASRDGTVVLYGLTVSRTWLLAYVEFRWDPQYKEHGLHAATRMILRTSTPEVIAAMAGITPEEVAYRVWKDVAGRERLATQAALDDAERQADRERDLMRAATPESDAARQSLEETRLRIAGYHDRLHDLHSIEAWLRFFHPRCAAL